MLKRILVIAWILVWTVPTATYSVLAYKANIAIGGTYDEWHMMEIGIGMIIGIPISAIIFISTEMIRLNNPRGGTVPQNTIAGIMEGANRSIEEDAGVVDTREHQNISGEFYAKNPEFHIPTDPWPDNCRKCAMMEANIANHGYQSIDDCAGCPHYGTRFSVPYPEDVLMDRAQRMGCPGGTFSDGHYIRFAKFAPDAPNILAYCEKCLYRKIYFTGRNRT